ncbi:MAG: J domain-containing protein [Hyphomicrobium sp.]
MADATPRKRRLRGSYAAEEPRPCAHPGCSAEGEFRAPVRKPRSAFEGPAGPPEWQYLCLEHVRAFNASWNYFEGMSQEEIFAAQSPYPSWERETKAFAHNAFAEGPDRVVDALGVLRWRAAGAHATGRRSATGQLLSRDDLQALSVLGLADDATLAEVKRRYRALVRRYHPDSHGGDRRHEARLQRATEAHDHLRQSPAMRG